MVWAGRGGALGQCDLAYARVGDFRRGLYRRGDVRDAAAARDGGAGAVGAGGGGATVGVFRRDGWRDWIFSRGLGSRFAAAGVGPGLFRWAPRGCRIRRARKTAPP